MFHVVVLVLLCESVACLLYVVYSHAVLFDTLCDYVLRLLYRMCTRLTLVLGISTRVLLMHGS